MSENIIAAPVPTEVELKQEELTFGVDEAVDVLSTIYETNRGIKLDESREILDDAIEVNREVVAELKDAIDVSEYNHTSDTLGIRSRVQDVKINIGKTIEDSNIRVILMLTDLDITGERYVPEFGKFRNLPMEDHAEMYDVIVTANDVLELVEKTHRKLVNKLDNVSEIRRQLRAKVMTVKLTDAGLGDVLTDTEVLAIVTI
jgi:hypothetical protein